MSESPDRVVDVNITSRTVPRADQAVAPGVTPRMITVGYYAAAEDAAGSARERIHTHATTVGELAREICERHGEPLASIVTVSSFLVGEETTRDPHASLDGVWAIDVLPPFAGG